MSRVGALSIAGPWLVTVGLFVAVVVIAAGITTGESMVDAATVAFLAVTTSWGLVLATVGALIAYRRPQNRIGRLLQVSGMLVVSVFLGYVLASVRATAAGPGDLIGGVSGWWASATLYLAIYLAFPLIGLFYPDGRLPGPRWRLPILFVSVAEIAASAVFAFAAGPLGPGLPTNPFGFVVVSAAVRNAAELVGPLALVFAMACAVVAIAVRWRRGSRVERSQLKWLLAAMVVAGILFPLTFASSANDASPDLLTDLGVASALLIPIAIGIAILRYRLYEIDRLISRSISWALISGVLAAVFGALVVALQAVLAGVTQRQTLAVAASTLAAFALFQPVRRQVQSIVDRRFDRARYDAQHTVDVFGEHLRSEVNLERQRMTLVATAAAAVQPMSAGVWLRAPIEDRRWGGSGRSGKRP